MIKISKHIEIVRSSTKGLSSMSQVSCDAIFDVLSKYFAEVGVTVINNEADISELVASQPDLVFLGMEFVPSDPLLGLTDPNKIWLSDVFDDLGIAYTGSSRAAHELGRYKPLAKQRVLDTNLKTSTFCVIEQKQPLRRRDITLHFPLFVKPTNRGGGLGIDSNSIVHNFEQLLTKVRSINTTLSADALIEEYLPGREFSVAILREKSSEEYLVMPIELVAPSDKSGSRLLSGRVKSANSELVLGVSDPVLRAKITTLALNVFNALGARDYGRIDIRLDVAGAPHFLEANLIPSLISGYGSFPKACILNFGLEYEPMIMQIVNPGLTRSKVDTKATLESIMIEGTLRSKEVVFGQV